MDNYEFSRTFEQLAIKIVEEHFGYKLDHKKSHITRTTRDYGIDSVIFFTNRTIYSSTIEAKLRKSNYTLGLKDIASSILFFLVRKGDEHYIVSNVYITEGTIETLELLNLQTQSKIYYIDGENTKVALENLVEKLTDSDEITLAQTLIQNFVHLKNPLRTKGLEKTSCTLYNPNLFEELQSRKKILHDLSEALRVGKRIIIFRGKIGTGKRTLLKRFFYSLEKSNYNIITVDAYTNNTIDVFCYEVTQKLLGLDLKDILCMFTNQEIDEIRQNLNEVEKEDLNNIFQIFQNNKLSNEVAVYLAKVYLKNLFNKFNQLKYVIEIQNYSYTSQEVFDFIKDFIVDAPENVSIIFVFSEDITAKHSDFSYRYKQLYSNILEEIPCEVLSFEETEFYLKKTMPMIDSSLVKQIYEFTNGLPNLLEIASRKIQKLVLINAYTVSMSLDSLNIYLNREYLNTMEENSYALKFLFALHLFSFDMKKSIWKDIEQRDNKIQEEQRKAFQEAFFDNYFFIEEANATYILKSVYMHNNINDYYEKNVAQYHEYTKSIKDVIFSNETTALTRIKTLFYCDEAEIISEYEKSKQLWMYKTNTSWKIDSLKYICKYLFFHETEQIDYMLQATKYYLEYLEIKKYYTNFEIVLLQKLEFYINIFEGNYSSIPQKYSVMAAHCLAYFYRYKYSHYRRQSDYDKALTYLEPIVHREWFCSLDDVTKIELERCIALLYKSQGNRKKFLRVLDDILFRYKSNSYAKVIYWANQAARFYTSDISRALACLENCELENFKKLHSDENKLYLWVFMDEGIVSFYNKDVSLAKKISYQVLNASDKINYMENVARAYNLLGATFLEERELDRAKEMFYYAVTKCVDEKSESFFHFAVNYLVTSNTLELKIVEVVMNYIKSQKKRLLNIFEKEQLSTCRWFVTLYAFNEYLHMVAPQMQKELELIYEKVLKSDSSSQIEKYKIQDLLIVLF